MGVRAADPVFQEATYSVQDVSNNVTIIYAHPCIYYGAVVTTVLSAAVVVVQDVSTIIDAFAASSAVGTLHALPAGIRCDTNLTINPDDASTGIMTVYYRPLAGFPP